MAERRVVFEDVLARSGFAQTKNENVRGREEADGKGETNLLRTNTVTTKIIFE